ncbi:MULTISPECIES: pyruvate formate-lyase-activating protein [Anaerofustis]|uniref:pyruvate formate-lyase-activating protein n=1 Tax=Anaerofustis TaxID=264995 RepID=UPI001105A55A|nr:MULTISPECIES: pyruvate formate-lyase-activating protein [Anaerofustis]MCO8193595.1 pyruvate formate-lyase-activating protein [Anaerofustis sp. NSJ-163]
MGKIHSIESMGLVDGPGIRTVVFLQGCNLRCQYCHNPDTWDLCAGEEMTVDEVINKIKRFKPYFKNNGGVTFSGGEPLMQPEFLLELLKKCKENDIHTCIDTAGYGKGDYDEILKYTDLILYDIKHEDYEKYNEITRRKQDETLKFIKKVQENNIPIWIRHVVVPGLTDSEEHMKALKGYIDTIKNVEKVELLPFHQLGREKYKVMGIDYPLEDTEPMEKDVVEKYQKIFFNK